MSRVPSVDRLLREASRPTLTVSIRHLKSVRARLGAHEDLEAFVFWSEANDPRLLQGVEYHLIRARSRLRATLATHGIYISAALIDDLLFHFVVHAPRADPCRRTLEFIRSSRLTAPGLLVFPLIGFGLLGVGLLRWRARARVQYAVPEARIVVSPQTNSYEDALEFLHEAARELGIRRRIPRADIDHFQRSRPLKWFTHNPLAVLRVRSYSRFYFDNQALNLLELEAGISLLCLLVGLQHPPSHTSLARDFSSSRVNNWETRDIYHYLLLEPSGGRRRYLNAHCVPMNVDRSRLMEIPLAPIHIAPVYWKRRPRMVQRLSKGVSAVVNGYIGSVLPGAPPGVASRVFRKLWDSLEFYRRSFRPSGHASTQIINLCIAFEVLLTDHYRGGMRQMLRKHLQLALRGTPGTKVMQEQLEALYNARSTAVHQGTVGDAPDLGVLRKAFALAFVAITEKLPHLPSVSGTPILDLLRR